MRSHQKSVALTQLLAPDALPSPSLHRPPHPPPPGPAPPQNPGIPSRVPLPGTALWARCGRVSRSSRPKVAGHDCRRKVGLTEGALCPLQAGRNCCGRNQEHWIQSLRQPRSRTSTLNSHRTQRCLLSETPSTSPPLISSLRHERRKEVMFGL